MPASIELKEVSVKTASGRALFEGLNLRMDHEHVALVGRNGVGKSTLLSLIAGETHASSGRVRVRSRPHFVPQIDERPEPFSRGELRRIALEAARTSRAEILLLDEPTLHLDDRAVAWLRAWLAEYGSHRPPSRPQEAQRAHPRARPLHAPDPSQPEAQPSPGLPGTLRADPRTAPQGSA